MNKRKRNSREESIEKVLEVAFLFYATMPYDKVNFEEMAKQTHISSGGIFYHFKTKNALFIQMCDKYILTETSIFLKLEQYENTTFIEYLDKYIEVLAQQKAKAKELGINNLNKALINITNQAIFYYPKFIENADMWLSLQVKQWKKLLNKDLERELLKENIDIDLAARLFEDVYRGMSYAAITDENGIDLHKLKESFVFLYNTFKI